MGVDGWVYIGGSLGATFTTSSLCLELDDWFFLGGDAGFGGIWEERIGTPHCAVCDGTVTVVVTVVVVVFWFVRASLRRAAREEFEGSWVGFGAICRETVRAGQEKEGEVVLTLDFSPYDCSSLISLAFSSFTVKCSKRDSIARVAIFAVVPLQAL